MHLQITCDYTVVDELSLPEVVLRSASRLTHKCTEQGIMQAEARLVTSHLYHLVVDGACILSTTSPWNTEICNDQYVEGRLGRHSALLDHRLQ
uniref:Uncharacterized protein n=1 Tax=Arundo donax TaxID=35708 RepID=A0A0A9FQT0_ARUDO